MGPPENLFQKLWGPVSAERTALSFGYLSPWSLRPEAAANAPTFSCVASLLLKSLLSGMRRTEEGHHPPRLLLLLDAPTITEYLPRARLMLGSQGVQQLFFHQKRPKFTSNKHIMWSGT